MTQYLRQLISLLTATALGGLILLGIGFQAMPALAAIRQLEEAPGQVVYQSRQTLTDQSGQRWQAIAFKRTHPDGKEQVHLRLVGFPGTAAINRSQPLTLTSSLGQTFTAADTSSEIFTNDAKPEPHVGQYDIQPVVAQLRPELTWHLTLATTTQPLTLAVPPATIQEWQAIAQSQLDSPYSP
ncbi:MAG: DUF3122 domain-containing protein [Cyanobacteria bacterium]|nr:DUF3122 domain-containing protein [Cyanobacteriota bacterium]MDA0867038.1 DUF3122 domain-containing protein [Cyanobacteriota bacterium]